MDANQPWFTLGMEFTNACEFRKAIAQYAVVRVVKITFIRNEPYRIRTVCQENCPFLIFVSRTNKDNPLVVKIFNGAHKCYRVFKNPKVSARYLANCFKNRVYQNISTRVRDFKHFVKKKN